MADFLRPKLSTEKFKLFADTLQSVVVSFIWMTALLMNDKGGKLPQETLWKQLPAIVGPELANEAVKVYTRESALVIHLFECFVIFVLTMDSSKLWL